MRLSSLSMLLLGLLLFLTCGCDRTPPLPKLSSDAVVLAFGDSLTFGTGANPAESYPEVLQSLLGRRIINAGVPGEVSAEGLQRLPQLLEANAPELVILCHGGNDFLRRQPVGEVAANLRAMIELIHARGAAVVLVGVPQPGLTVQPPDFYPELAKEFALPYEGEILHQLLTDRELKSDTVHPNAAGYRRLAEALHQLIARAQAR